MWWGLILSASVKFLQRKEILCLPGTGSNRLTFGKGTKFSLIPSKSLLLANYFPQAHPPSCGSCQNTGGVVVARFVLGGLGSELENKVINACVP